MPNQRVSSQHGRSVVDAETSVAGAARGAYFARKAEIALSPQRRASFSRNELPLERGAHVSHVASSTRERMKMSASP
eukprot:6934116-Pyramimonas_sp.AAC.1